MLAEGGRPATKERGVVSVVSLKPNLQAVTPTSSARPFDVFLPRLTNITLEFCQWHKFTESRFISYSARDVISTQIVYGSIR